MSRRSTDKRHRFLGIFSDPWRKIISIALATLLWYYLNARITKTHDEIVPLIYNSSSTALATSKNHIEIRLTSPKYSHREFFNGDTRSPLTGVTLELSGPNRLIGEATKPGQMLFAVTLSEEDININPQTPPFISFRLEDVHHKHDSEYDKLLQRMRPRNIRVELQKNSQERMTLTDKNVRLEVLGPDPDEFQTRVQNTSFTPEFVLIFASEAQLARIDATTELFTATVNTRQIGDRTMLTVEMQLAKEFADQGVTIAGQKPVITYTIDPIRETYRLINVPVVLDTVLVGPEKGSEYEVDPPEVTITIKAANQLNIDLFDFRKAREKVTDVDEGWTKLNARFRVLLREADVNSTILIQRKPSLRLGKLDALDRETPYELGRDYIIVGGLPPITIRKKGGI